MGSDGDSASIGNGSESDGSEDRSAMTVVDRGGGGGDGVSEAGMGI